MEDLTRLQSTTRPDNVMPETWTSFSKKEKERAIKEWNAEKAKFDPIRDKRAIFHIEEAEEEEYKKIMAEVKRKLTPLAALAMPLCYFSATARGDSQQNLPNKIHEDHIAPVGVASSEWYALIHTPLSHKEALRIPKAKSALQEAWDKLGKKRKAWILESVMEREDHERSQQP